MAWTCMKLSTNASSRLFRTWDHPAESDLPRTELSL